MASIDIPKGKADFLNQEAIKVAGLIKQLDEPVVENRIKQGSISHMQAIDLRDDIIGPTTLRTLDSISSKQTIEIKECEGHKCIGYDTESCKEFSNLVAAAYKASSINSRITEDSLVKATLRWVIDFYKKLNVPPYIDFLIEYIDNSVSVYKIYFPIPNLHIDKFFKIGNVDFEYFTKDYFDKMTAAIIYNNDKYLPNENFKEIRNKYQGRVFAAYTVEADKDKAIEIAFEHCSLAVDVLKICTRTTLIPTEVLGFDIDSKVTTAPKREVIATNPNDISAFTVTMVPDQYPYEIDREEFTQMTILGLEEYSKFLLNLGEKNTELQDLIISSIKRYSSALSKRDLHQRIVELHTILESLLLPNASSLILESVTKYLPMIVEKEITHRQDCIKLVKLTYDIRSKLIHHGKKSPFNMEELRKLQTYTITLLINFLIKSESHTQKASILKEIDDAIMRAY